MPDLFLTFLIALPILAVAYAVLRRAASKEKRVQAQRDADRVYYPRRSMEEDVPEWKRREPE